MPYELEYNLLQEKYVERRVLDQITDTFESLIKYKHDLKNILNFREPFRKNQTLFINHDPAKSATS